MLFTVDNSYHSFNFCLFQIKLEAQALLNTIRNKRSMTHANPITGQSVADIVIKQEPVELDEMEMAYDDNSPFNLGNNMDEVIFDSEPENTN